jgi:integrase
MRDRRHHESAAAQQLADWLAWLELGGKAATTRDAYERTGAALLVMYPNVSFDEFTDSHLLPFLLAFPEKSRRIRKAHIASWFRWGFKTRRIPANPVDLLPDIRRHAARIPTLFDEDEIAALEALPLLDGPLMCLLFEGGLRKKEARCLDAGRFDFDSRMITLNKGTKGDKPRRVPMIAVPTPADSEGLRLASSLAKLTVLEGLNAGDHLWYTRAGGVHRVIRRRQPCSDTAFTRWWVRCLDEAHVPYRNIHATRHTFATRWRRFGLAKDDLMVVMGHASEASAATYDHTSVHDVAARMAALMERVR